MGTILPLLLQHTSDLCPSQPPHIFQASSASILSELQAELAAEPGLLKVEQASPATMVLVGNFPKSSAGDPASMERRVGDFKSMCLTRIDLVLLAGLLVRREEGDLWTPLLAQQ